MGGRERLENPPETWTVTIAELDGVRVSIRRNEALEAWPGASALSVRFTVELAPRPDPRVAPHARVQELDAFEGRLVSAIRDQGVPAVIMTDGAWRKITCYLAPTARAHDIAEEAAAILRHHDHEVHVEHDPEWTLFRQGEFDRPALLGRPPSAEGATVPAQ